MLANKPGLLTIKTVNINTVNNEKELAHKPGLLNINTVNINTVNNEMTK